MSWLRKAPPLQCCSQWLLNQLAKNCPRDSVAFGEELARQGESSSELLLVRLSSSSAVITRSSPAVTPLIICHYFIMCYKSVISRIPCIIVWLHLCAYCFISVQSRGIMPYLICCDALIRRHHSFIVHRRCFISAHKHLRHPASLHHSIIMHHRCFIIAHTHTSSPHHS